jgi:hypothetical protein
MRTHICRVLSFGGVGARLSRELPRVFDEYLAFRMKCSVSGLLRDTCWNGVNIMATRTCKQQ